MTTRSAMTRTVLLGALALLMTACGQEETHHASAAPDRWWSDNYFAMLQDAGGDASAPMPGAKPIRMKLQ